MICLFVSAIGWCFEGDQVKYFFFRFLSQYVLEGFWYLGWSDGLAFLMTDEGLLPVEYFFYHPKNPLFNIF